MLPYREGRVRVSSIFGYRSLYGIKEYHSGVDLVGDDCKEVVAVIDGVIGRSMIVTDASNRTSEWGEYIRIDGKDGRYYYYCHLSKRLVKEGQTVKAGQVIGTEGSTGKSFGSHLHFEVREGSVSPVSVNPCNYIDIKNIQGYTVSVELTEAKESESVDNKTVKETGCSEWASEAVKWAIDNKILYGDGKGNYGLKENCTREQMLTFLYRAIKSIGDDGK